LGPPLIFLQRLKLAIPNLVHSLGLRGPIIKSYPEKKCGHGLGLGELLKILGFPYNISTTAGASDFKFGKQLGFFMARHKITRRRKDGHGPGLGELPQICGFSFNIYTMTEASDFKFGTQLGYAKAHHKITPRKKWGALG